MPTKTIPYITLLDLAQQRLASIAASPNFTREVRNTALKMQREVADELADANMDLPTRRLTLIVGGPCMRIAA